MKIFPISGISYGGFAKLREKSRGNVAVSS